MSKDNANNTPERALKDRSAKLHINIPKSLSEWLKANCGGLCQPTQTDFIVSAIAEKIERAAK